MKNDLSHDPGTQGLLDYCQQESCFISPKIRPHRFPHSGLGIRVVKPIKKGRELMHVPSHVLLTPASVPSSFIAAKSRKHLKVHALLAAYLAFCPDATRYTQWMSSWPKLQDFRTGMPLFWPTSAIFSSHHFAAPTTQPPPSSSLQEVTQKYETDLAAVARLLPHLSSQLTPSSTSPEALRFQHMWACVNTRCFYYVLPGQQPPSDTNEAMALCPSMDLFNHVSSGGCEVRYDKTGYYVSADRDYSVGEELLLCYGSHSNEALWVEYGFMLPEPESAEVEDFVRVDDVVLQDWRAIGNKKALLEKHGYWGGYEIRDFGACWRMEIAGWCCILDEYTWLEVVKGKYDPSKDTELNNTQKNGLKSWIEMAGLFASRQSQNLKGRKRDKSWIVEAFGDSPDVLRAVMEYDGFQDPDTDTVREKQAVARYGMCVLRWEQIISVYDSALH